MVITARCPKRVTAMAPGTLISTVPTPSMPGKPKPAKMPPWARPSSGSSSNRPPCATALAQVLTWMGQMAPARSLDSLLIGQTEGQ